MLLPPRRLSWLALALALLPAAPAPGACESGTPSNVCLLVPDGSSSDDVSPYCFLPALSRGQSTTNYAVTAEDDTGVCHHFETYLRFELPPDLLVSGETVTEAYLDVPYLFSFSIDGPPSPPPHPPVMLRVHRVSAPWIENGVVWNQRPAYEAMPLDSVGNITSYQAVTFDVTDLVRAWAHGTAANHGFVLTTPDDRVLGFHSWEASVPEEQKLALLIVRGAGPPPPACGDLEADGDVDASDLQRVRRFLADPAGQPLSAAGAARCNVIDAGTACSLRDAVVLARALADPPQPPGIAPVCSAVTGS
jgi:hypothetical protein